MGALPLEVVVKFKDVSGMDVSTKARNQTNPISVGTAITFKDKMGFVHCNGSQWGLRRIVGMLSI